ncbi:TSUP family transporter [Hathewaya histolytica]|uniref:TSUP family transporter n=1 Tax=Hathewaya histolytica TaxID=1498 RepID=UPI003B67581D
MFKLIFLCVAGFLAAFVDAIAGGGGLISVPAFLMAGIPPHLTLGTNKFCATSGSLTSSIKFAKSKKVNFNLIKYLIPFTFLGSVLGVVVVGFIPSDFLQGIVFIMILFIGVYTIFSKTLGMEDKEISLSKKRILYGIIFAFSLGFYDGFFGPGTGSFLIFGFIKIFGHDFTKATGNAKFLNFVSNVSALLMFAIKGQIIYSYAIPIAIFMILGAKIGTKLAIDNGARFIKPIFIVMSLAVGIKILFPYINKLF